MLPVADISVGIAGAARLARFDLEGFEYFDNSIHGFWQSFYAAVVIAPLFLILILIQYLTTEGGGPFLHYLIIEGLAYVIAWTAFPVIMLSFSYHLGREMNYIRYFVAYNWIAVIQSIVYMPIAVFGITGAFPPDVANLLALMALLWILALTFFVTRHALEIPPGTAVAVVAMDFLLGLLIETISSRFA